MNTNDKALKNFVERLFNVEQSFAEQKGEYTDAKKDLKTEIKSRFDETGVTAEDVERLVKIRMDEEKAIERQETVNADMHRYEQLFGLAASGGAEDASDEDASDEDASDEDASEDGASDEDVLS
jgi:hypothetical protein